MSFEDVYEVDIDLDDETFTMIRNNGTVQTYDINREYDLFLNILDSGSKGELEVFGIRE